MKYSFHSLPTQLKFPLSHSPSLTPIIETFPLKLSSTCKTLLLLPFLPYLLLAIRVSLKNGKGSFSLSICRQCVSLVVHSLTLHCHSFPDTHSKTFLLICLRCASVSPPIPSPYLVSSMVGNIPASPQNSSGIIYFETEGPESLRFYANTMQCPCLMPVYLPICIFCLIKFS